jgi:hypothetical protein
MTELLFGCLFGYIAGHYISDSIWQKRFEETDNDEEWEEVIPKKHIKRRRYS